MPQKWLRKCQALLWILKTLSLAGLWCIIKLVSISPSPILCRNLALSGSAGDLNYFLSLFAHRLMCEIRLGSSQEIGLSHCGSWRKLKGNNLSNECLCCLIPYYAYLYTQPCLCILRYTKLYSISIHSTAYTLYSYVKGIENGLFYVLWQWTEPESKALQFYVIFPSLGRECSLKFHIEIQLSECMRPFQRYEYPHTTLTLAPAHINTHTHIHMQYANFAKQNASTWQRERGSLGLGLGL